jgi:hypothetical protein
LPALAFAVLSTAGLLAQKGGSGAELTVSVTVTPICTVAVRPVRVTEQALDLRCRNFAATQPQPLVMHGADAIIFGDALVRDGGADVIVINF